ncbi:alpha/beta fold hydrolase [Nocardia panacis]|uniref:alpha/beta fold hydrolase n=1 Tax=Nocardia panacis TaxID=2340916 RepID=UPI00193A9347|nr:alpha/beta hydrolase [Nocardia panacis]
MNGITLAYEDFGGVGRPLVALHGSFGRGAIFARLAADLAGRVRVVAPDLRGHGHTGRAPSYTDTDFVADIAELLTALDLGPVALLGHSRGGIAAYQVAAAHPHLVSALIIEDVGPIMRTPEIATPILDVRGWPDRAPTKAALAEAIRAEGIPDPTYFMQSAIETDGHWRFLFDWADMMAVQTGGLGDWWPTWLASTCPALVLRAEHSSLLPATLAAEMVARRPDTDLVEIPNAGHWIHDDAPAAFAAAIAAFLYRP